MEWFGFSSAGWCFTSASLKNVPSAVSWFVHPNTMEETPYDFQRPIRSDNDFLSPVVMQKTLKDLCIQQEPHCLIVTTGSMFRPHAKYRTIGVVNNGTFSCAFEKWNSGFDALSNFDSLTELSFTNVIRMMLPKQFHRFADDFNKR